MCALRNIRNIRNIRTISNIPLIVNALNIRQPDLSAATWIRVADVLTVVSDCKHRYYLLVTSNEN